MPPSSPSHITKPPSQTLSTSTQLLLFFRPILLLLISTAYIPFTTLHLLLHLQFRPFTSFTLFRSAWFSHFWSFLGHESRKLFSPFILPLISNHASGVCLDIGPGQGEWVHLFAEALKNTNSSNNNNNKITKIYGIEPNTNMHAALRSNIKKAGLEGIYTILPLGAEDLKTKFEPGGIDTIITVQCLCSIPHPQTNITALARLLRPGGRWLVFEHIRAGETGSFLSRWADAINSIWPTFFGGCDIRRPLDLWLVESAKWKDVQLDAIYENNPYDPVPHVVGTLTKA